MAHHTGIWGLPALRGRVGGRVEERCNFTIPTVALLGTPAHRLNEAYREASRALSLRSYCTLARPPPRKSKSLISCVTRPYRRARHHGLLLRRLFIHGVPSLFRALLSLPLYRPHHPSLSQTATCCSCRLWSCVLSLTIQSLTIFTA
jgi:hypothetical protein